MMAEQKNNREASAGENFFEKIIKKMEEPLSEDNLSCNTHTLIISVLWSQSRRPEPLNNKKLE